MRSKKNVSLIVGGIASLVMTVLYNDWMFTSIFNPSISLSASLISEISARTQPNHQIFQTADKLAGICTILLLPLIAQFAKRKGLPKVWLLVLAVGVLGIGSYVDASLPISCAPSLDRSCNLADKPSLITEAHMVESTIIGAATFVAPLLWWWHSRRRDSVLAYASAGFMALQVVVGAVVLMAEAKHIEIVGTLQRIYELGLGVWIATIIGVATRFTIAPLPRPECRYRTSTADSVVK